MSRWVRLLSRLAEALPDRDALVYPRADARWTFRSLNGEACLIARGLVANGVKPGDRVAVWATNVPEWIILQFALAKIGAILVTVNTSLRANEIEYLLRQSDTSTLVTIAGFRQVRLSRRAPLQPARSAIPAATRRERLPHLSRVIFIGDDCPDDLIPYDDLRARPVKFRPAISTRSRPQSASTMSSTCNTPRARRASRKV